MDSKIVSRVQLLPGIHGLRGVAALAVVIFHVVYIGGVSVPDWVAYLTREFHYSVHLFFILSAYSLMHSTQGTLGNPDWARNYFIKRLFRIAPLYYFVIILLLTLELLRGHLATDIDKILLNVTFVFGFIPFSEIVWGGWSVGLEMIFYVLFPVLLILIRSLRAAAGLLLAGIAVSYLTRYVLHHQYRCTIPLPELDLSYYSFLPNLAFFCMGIFAYFLVQHMKERGGGRLRAVQLFTVGVLSIQLFIHSDNLRSAGGAHILLWGVAFTGLAVWQGFALVRQPRVGLPRRTQLQHLPDAPRGHPLLQVTVAWHA